MHHAFFMVFENVFGTGINCYLGQNTSRFANVKAVSITTSETEVYNYNYELYVHLALGAAKK